MMQHMILHQSGLEVFSQGCHWKHPKTALCDHWMLTQCIYHQQKKLQQLLMQCALLVSTSMHSNAVACCYGAESSHCFEMLDHMSLAAQCSWEEKLVLTHTSEKMQHSAMERIL